MYKKFVWSDAAERYKTPIADIFSSEQKLKYQLLVEASLAKIQAQLGIISEEDAKIINESTNSVEHSRVKEIESEIHHDLMAVVKALSEKAGKAGEKVHLAATSNDIQDTVLALQMKNTRETLLDLIDELSETLYKLAEKNKDIACIGRTHGQFAVPTTVGFKFANFLYELYLAKQELQLSKIQLAKFSGAVGTMAAFGDKGIEVQKRIMDKLGLKPVLVANQVLQRDRHAELIMLTSLISATMSVFL